jgi:uncharacterized protein YndB with AHSA1/START domain
MESNMDRIEKELILRAPRSRVWQALTDAEAFGKWFGVELEGPFVPGERLRGRISQPEWAHLPFEITVERMEPERLFSWRWHPHPVEPKRDYSVEPTTLVEFELSEVAGATRLRVVESGFAGIPEDRRATAFRGNTEGWAYQLEAIANYVRAAA